MITLDTAKDLVTRYHDWLRDKTEMRVLENGAGISIETPFLDRHNDCIEIYLRQQENGFLLTDGGDTLDGLAMDGVSFERSTKRQDLLQSMVAGFGVRLDGGEMTIPVNSPQDFPKRKHSIIQAILSVNDMFYLAEPVIVKLFLEDVSDWLNKNHIRHVPGIKIPGKSGYNHHFDFVIPSSDQEPERMIRAINWPNSDAAKIMAFAWTDVQRMRPSEAKAIAILNDKEHKPSGDVYNALREYDIQPLPWSTRKDWALKLAV